MTEIGACGLWTCKNMTAANCYMTRLLQKRAKLNYLLKNKNKNKNLSFLIFLDTLSTGVQD